MKKISLVLLTVFLALNSYAASEVVFHCEESNKYCGFNESKMYELKAEIEEMENLSDNLNTQNLTLDKIRENQEIREEMREKRRKKAEYRRLRSFYDLYINGSNVTYSSGRNPEKVDLAVGRYIGYTNIYPKSNYTLENLKIEEGCKETIAEESENFYLVRWTISNDWHCSYPGYNLLREPLRYLSNLNIFGSIA